MTNMSKFGNDDATMSNKQSKRVKAIFENFQKKNLKPMHMGKTDFSAKQRAIEEQIDAGTTFSHLSD